MSQPKKVRSVVRQEDLEVAVAAVRTAWTMTGIGRPYGEISLDQTARDLLWIPPVGTAVTARSGGAAARNCARNVN